MADICDSPDRPDRPDRRRRCRQGFCEYLYDYIGDEVTLTLDTGQVVSGELVDISASGIILLREREIVSPFIGEVITMVRESDVVTVSVQTEVDS